MPLLAGVDWFTVGLLAAVVLLDGLRKVPADALILRSVLGGPWLPVEVAAKWRAWQVVSLWPPISRHIVLPIQGASSDSPDVAGNLHRLGWTARALTICGCLTLGGLVLGIPVAAARFGGWGLVAAAVVVEVLAVVSSAVAFSALRRLGLSGSAAARKAAVLLSPFTAPRAGELVIEAAVDQMPSIAVLRALLSEETFDAWLRPRAYDALRGSSDPMFRAGLTRESLDAVVGARPPGVSGLYCPRCSASYRDGVMCRDCDDVGLIGG